MLTQSLFKEKEKEKERENGLRLEGNGWMDGWMNGLTNKVFTIIDIGC